MSAETTSSRFEQFWAAGITLAMPWDKDTIFQLPTVDLVIYLLRMSATPAGFNQAFANSPELIMSAFLVAAALPAEVYRMDGYALRELVAKTILGLCPPKERCLFFPGFSELLAETGVTSSIVDLDHEALRRVCTCERCKAEVATIDAAEQDDELRTPPPIEET